MVLLYFGKDAFRLHEHMLQTVKQFKEKRDPHGYNTFVLSAVEDVDAIWEAIGSAPFMAEKKMVVIKHVMASKDKDFQDVLFSRLDTLNADDGVVVLVYEEGDGYKGKLWQALVSLDYSQEFAVLKGAQLQGWIREQVDVYGVTIEAEACMVLAKNYAEDMWSLHHVCLQIASFVLADGRAIVTADDCRIFLPEVVDDNTFHVLDAIHAGEGGRAMQLLDDQWKSGKSMVEVVGLLLWQWRVLLQVKALLEREPGFKGRDVASALKMHSFVADKSCRLVREVDFDALRTRYERLIEIDEMSKTGGAAEAALTTFVFETKKHTS